MSHVTYRGNFPTTPQNDPESPTKNDGTKKKILVRRAGEPKKGVWQEPTERQFVKQFYNDRRLNPFHPDVTIYRSPDFYTSVNKRPGKRKKPSIFEKAAPEVELAFVAPAVAELVHPPAVVETAEAEERLLEANPNGSATEVSAADSLPTQIPTEPTV